MNDNRSNEATRKVAFWCVYKEDVVMYKMALEKALESVPPLFGEVLKEAIKVIDWENLLRNLPSAPDEEW